MVLLDEQHGMVHMLATCPQPPKRSGQSGGDICEKTAPMAAPSFAPGPDAGLPDAGSPDMNDVTSTKQSLSAATGMVVLANNATTDVYWHAFMPLERALRPPGSCGGEVRELEARTLAELPHEAHAKGLVVARRTALAPESQPGGKEVALHVVVQRVDLGESLQVADRGGRVVDMQVRKRPQRLARDRVQPVALCQRPFGVRLVRQEVAVEHRDGSSQAIGRPDAISDRQQADSLVHRASKWSASIQT